jgi:hypothetical protein
LPPCTNQSSCNAINAAIYLPAEGPPNRSPGKSRRPDYRGKKKSTHIGADSVP